MKSTAGLLDSRIIFLKLIWNRYHGIKLNVLFIFKPSNEKSPEFSVILVYFSLTELGEKKLTNLLVAETVPARGLVRCSVPHYLLPVTERDPERSAYISQLSETLNNISPTRSYRDSLEVYFGSSPKHYFAILPSRDPHQRFSKYWNCRWRQSRVRHV